MVADTGIFEIKKHDGRCHAAQPVTTILNLESEEISTQFPDGEILVVSKKMVKDEKAKSKYRELLTFFKKVIKNPPRGFEVRQIRT